MGYQRSTLRLTWPEGDELHGLEVQMRRLSIGALADAQATAAGLGDGRPLAVQLQTVADLVVSGLIGWNLEIETIVNGEVITQPVPAGADGVAAQDFALVLAILYGWIEAATAVPLGQSKRSSSGEPSASDSEPPVSPLEESWAPALAASQEPIAAPV